MPFLCRYIQCNKPEYTHTHGLQTRTLVKKVTLTEDHIHTNTNSLKEQIKHLHTHRETAAEGKRHERIHTLLKCLGGHLSSAISFFSRCISISLSLSMCVCVYIYWVMEHYPKNASIRFVVFCPQPLDTLLLVRSQLVPNVLTHTNPLSRIHDMIRG